MVLCEDLKTRIPSERKQFCNGVEYIDRFCDIKPAGTNDTCDKVNIKECLQYSKGPQKPAVIAKFNKWNSPEVGEPRIFHSKVCDPEVEIARSMSHGIVSQDRTKVADLIRPKEPTRLESLLNNINESIYDSVKKRPIAKGPEPNIPSHIDRYETTFGLPNIKDEGIKPLINPSKRPVELMQEEANDRLSYYKSHKHLAEGEQGHRNYINFDPNKTFGVKTNDGMCGNRMKKLMNWFTEEEAAKYTPVIDKRKFDFNERFESKVGKSKDPLRDTRAVSPEHVYGLPSRENEGSVAQLLHGRVPRKLIALPDEPTCVERDERFRRLKPVIHHVLRQNNFWRVTDLTAVLCNLGADNDLLPMIVVRRLMRHFDLPLDEELTEQVFDVCQVRAPEGMMAEMRELLQKEKSSNEQLVRRRLEEEDMLDRAVNWRWLSEMLDWKKVGGTQLQDCKCVGKESALPQKREASQHVRARLGEAIDSNLLSWPTTNDQYAGDMNGLLNPDCWRRLGREPLRLTLPVPKFRSNADSRDYGEEAGAQAIIQPSIYGEYGLSNRDLLTLRSREELRAIVDGANLMKFVDPSWTFEKVWERAVALDKNLLKELAPPDGEKVSLQSFKQAVFEIRQKEIDEKVRNELLELCC